MIILTLLENTVVPANRENRLFSRPLPDPRSSALSAALFGLNLGTEVARVGARVDRVEMGRNPPDGLLP